MQVCLKGSPKIRHPPLISVLYWQIAPAGSQCFADSTQHIGHWCHFLEHLDRSKPRRGLGTSLNKHTLKHLPGFHIAICESRLLHVPAVLKQQQQQQQICHDALLPQVASVTAAL